jgi:hypothetical protein
MMSSPLKHTSLNKDKHISTFEDAFPYYVSNN